MASWTASEASAERTQRHVRREPGLGVGRELFGQRVPEAHVHGALHLTFDQHRVDGATDVVHGDHLLDRTGRPVRDRHLRREREARVDGRVGNVRVAEFLGPVDHVLPGVVDIGRAVGRERGLACLFDRSGRHQRAP